MRAVSLFKYNNQNVSQMGFFLWRGSDHTLLGILVELPPMWEFLHSEAKMGSVI